MLNESRPSDDSFDEPAFVTDKENTYFSTGCPILVLGFLVSIFGTS